MGMTFGGGGRRYGVWIKIPINGSEVVAFDGEVAPETYWEAYEGKHRYQTEAMAVAAGLRRVGDRHDIHAVWWLDCDEWRAGVLDISGTLAMGLNAYSPGTREPIEIKRTGTGRKTLYVASRFTTEIDVPSNWTEANADEIANDGGSDDRPDYDNAA